ncbi:teichuronic acid biosynthesis protein TuaE [Peribacillus sp. SCS-37]|uniref:teichuronic acid biosynthesis protein TuaE n=1 Tax=Paraperibacillus esterisolvens TaxID=3115296 RepID=UPI003906CC0D
MQRAVRGAQIASLLLIGLGAVCYWAGVSVFFIAALAFCMAVLPVIWLKKYMSRRAVSTLAVYMLLAASFLNQSGPSLDLGFVTLFLYRIILGGSVLLFLWHVVGDKMLPVYWENTRVKGTLLFLLFWLGYGMLSLLWAKDPAEGIKYWFLLCFGTAFIYLAAFTFTTLNRVITACAVWMAMSVLLMAIGVYNHAAAYQLPTSSLYGGPSYKLNYPTSVFFNQNDFAAFLTITFFFYMSGTKNVGNGFIKAGCCLLALLSIYLIDLTESRASLLGAAGGLAVYMMLVLPRVLKKAAVYFLTAVIAAGVLFILYQLPALHSDFQSGVLQTYGVLPSNTARINLLKNTFMYFTGSLGFGVGAGNLPYYLEHEPIYYTGAVLQVHNWLAEILGSFGIFVFGGYILMYGSLMIILFRMHGSETKKGRMLIEACLPALAGFLVSSISPSSVMNLYFHWVFLGIVIALVSVLKHRESRFP